MAFMGQVRMKNLVAGRWKAGDCTVDERVAPDDREPRQGGFKAQRGS